MGVDFGPSPRQSGRYAAEAATSAYRIAFTGAATSLPSATTRYFSDAYTTFYVMKYCLRQDDGDIILSRRSRAFKPLTNGDASRNIAKKVSHEKELRTRVEMAIARR